MQNRDEVAVGNTHTRLWLLASWNAQATQKYDFHLRFVHTFSFSYVTRVNLTAKFHLTPTSAEAGF
jgi:hypothetical protein